MVATEPKLHVTERIARLKKEFLDTKPSICAERASL